MDGSRVQELRSDLRRVNSGAAAVLEADMQRRHVACRLRHGIPRIVRRIVLPSRNDLSVEQLMLAVESYKPGHHSVGVDLDRVNPRLLGRIPVFLYRCGLVLSVSGHCRTALIVLAAVAVRAIFTDQDEVAHGKRWRCAGHIRAVDCIRRGVIRCKHRHRQRAKEHDQRQKRR